ncbi:MAG TPA: hypothetical protein VMM77_01760 [Gemmatimonadaceae bacterium]|nr:hypothetical protein [Gemmatimonadaceae bacterium]
MNIQRQAGLGAFGAAAGIAVLFAVFVWWTMPGPGTGMDRTSAVVAWISVGGVAVALIAAHVLVARVLVKGGQDSEGGPREGGG